MPDYRSQQVLNQVIKELGESYFYSKKRSVYRAIIESTERPLIEYILMKTEGNQLKAARILGINRNTLRSKIKKLGIKIK